MERKNPRKKTVSLTTILFLLSIFIGCSLILITLTQMEIIYGYARNYSTYLSGGEVIDVDSQSGVFFVYFSRTEIYDNKGVPTFSKNGLIERIDPNSPVPVWQLFLKNNRTYY
ncbi:MAG: hypothetical protein ACXQS8_02630, partial [Candidatus Helarchaeales archaeon]